MSSDQRLTAEQLAELRRLEQAATPGTWTPAVESDRGSRGDEYGRFYFPTFAEAPFTNFCDQEEKKRQGDADAVALCALRNAAKQLLAAAEREAGLRLALECMATRMNDPDFSGDEAAWIAHAALGGGPK